MLTTQPLGEATTYQKLKKVACDIPSVLDRLSLQINTDPDLKLLSAGIKLGGRGYTQVFPRDTIQSLMLMGSDYASLLGDHIRFSLKHQGTRTNPISGEEPGKSPHQSPHANIDGLSTEYAAVDTTPYTIAGAAAYWRWTKNEIFINSQASSLIAAYKYIVSHMDNGLLRDDPRDYHATASALKANYFRDGGFWEYPRHIQPYPAYYFNANALVVLALRGLADLREAGLLTEMPDANTLRQQAQQTVEMLDRHFWLNSGYYSPCWYSGQVNSIETMYLDPVWSCLFLEPDDLPAQRWNSMFNSLERLRSSDGYINRERVIGYPEDGGQSQMIEPSIWPIETAALMVLADRQGQTRIIRQCLKLADKLVADKYPFRECIEYGTEKIYPHCEYQLWTVAFYAVAERMMASLR